MKRITGVGLILMLTIIITNSYAQQLPLYSQYVLNGFLINPAVAGSDGFTTVNLTSKKHWLGYNEGPSTYSLSASARMLKRRTSVFGGKLKNARSGNVGIGANLFTDRNGAVSRTGGSFSYAYHIRIREGQLSLGLGGSVSQIGIDKSKLTFEDSESAAVQEAISHRIYTPDASVGIYYLSHGFFAGISADQLFQSALRVTGRDIDYRMLRQYYVLTGYSIALSDRYDLEPSILFRTNERFNNSADLMLKFVYNKVFWLGAAYRYDFKLNNTVIITTGVKIKEFFIGYAFDYSNNPLDRWGTHELILAYKFGDDERRYRWLDRY